MPNDEIINVRYMVDDVEESIAFYTELLGFEVLTSAAPAFADVKRGNLRLLLSGPKSSAGRPMPDGATPAPGGWNRIHFIVDDIDTEVGRLRDAGSGRSAMTSSKDPAVSRSCSRTRPATSSSSFSRPRTERRATSPTLAGHGPLPPRDDHADQGRAHRRVGPDPTVGSRRPTFPSR